MFNGFGNIQLDTDHTNFSYRDSDSWTPYTPKGSIKSITFEFGDEAAGPVVQLGLITKVDSEKLDWPHVIDPPHYHGSDQFRTVVDGEWELAGQLQCSGGYSIQASGLRYREHPGQDHTAWHVLVIGDRRGSKPTILRDADLESVIDIDNEHYQPVNKDEPYPHPAGPKGISAIASTLGEGERGYWRSSDEAMADNSITLSLFGDASVGPVACILKYNANQTVLPSSYATTERLIVIVRGSCTIGANSYQVGDMRIQQSNSTIDDIVSGSNGVTIAMIIADRSATLNFQQADVQSLWQSQIDALKMKLAA